MPRKEFLIFIPALDNYFMVAPWAFKTFHSREAAKEFIDKSDNPVFNNVEIKEIIVDEYQKTNLFGCSSIIGVIIIVVLTGILLCI